MQREFRYDIEILHLLVSDAHAYFGRAREGAAKVVTNDVDWAEVIASKGIVGDRFFGKAAHMDAAVTLFAIESLEAWISARTRGVVRAWGWICVMGRGRRRVGRFRS